MQWKLSILPGGTPRALDIFIELFTFCRAFWDELVSYASSSTYVRVWTTDSHLSTPPFVFHPDALLRDVYIWFIFLNQWGRRNTVSDSVSAAFLRFGYHKIQTPFQRASAYRCSNLYVHPSINFLEQRGSSVYFDFTIPSTRLKVVTGITNYLVAS